MRPIDLNPGEAILHEGDPDRCAVLLPGVRYFSQAPLLWFARTAAQAQGWSVLEVSERAPGDEDPFRWIRSRAERALDAAPGTRLAVIGKSLGSAAAPLAAKRGLPGVWLTPLLVRPEIARALQDATAPRLLVGSTADDTWANDGLPGGDAVEVLEFEGLDHSLEVPGDPIASLKALRRVTERIGAFFERLA